MTTEVGPKVHKTTVELFSTACKVAHCMESDVSAESMVAFDRREGLHGEGKHGEGQCEDGQNFQLRYQQLRMKGSLQLSLIQLGLRCELRSLWARLRGELIDRGWG